MSSKDRQTWRRKKATYELSMDVELRQQKRSFLGLGAWMHPRQNRHHSTSMVLFEPAIIFT